MSHSPIAAVKILPSNLWTDFRRLGQQIEEVQQAEADAIHVDVMDGRFVPNLTIGPFVVEAVRKSTSLPLQVPTLSLCIRRPAPTCMSRRAAILGCPITATLTIGPPTNFPSMAARVTG